MGKHVEMNELTDVIMLPDWVPVSARHYIAHTEAGSPIRVLARAAGCHASTILRQIRKLEMRRDDPLVDAALRKLGAAAPPDTGVPRKGTSGDLPGSAYSGSKETDVPRPAGEAMPDPTTLYRDAVRVLRRLCESGAVLAVAADLDKAVVVRDGPGGATTRTAVVDAAVAQAMALNEWIAPGNTGRIIRYHITGGGRSALAELLDKFGMTAEPATGLAEKGVDFVFGAGDTAAPQDADETNGRNRYALGESPLSVLARRRDKAGKPFLDDALVNAGERLREDFELAQMDGSVTQNWDHFLTAGSGSTTAGTGSGAGAAAEARARVRAALTHLGEGLSDVALRCCCYLEGLETTEKRLGWSARSGKVVLRIALLRLQRHYDETVGRGGPMIG